MKTVLLIEDDLDIQRIYSEKLEGAGYEVFLAADGTQGIQLINEKNPNLILLDIMLPGKINGLELLEQLKADENFKNIPIIVLTNLDTEKDNAMDIGANDYLLKASTDLNVLVEKVKKYI